ncbi:hypothetical protein ACVWWI_001338 [Bradyrhizobium sp. USDA 3686]|nr:hypothetical protein [Bradyrhizobium canariense]
MGRVAGRLISRRSCGFVLREGEKPSIPVVCALEPLQVTDLREYVHLRGGG